MRKISRLLLFFQLLFIFTELLKKNANAAKLGGFMHGVASGDPLPTSIILWTKYTPKKRSRAKKKKILLLLSEIDQEIPSKELLDDSKNPNIKKGVVMASKTSDWIVKLDVQGLKPNTNYVFAFTDGKVTSNVGQTKTAPGDEAVLELTFAVFSSASFTHGYFHSYDVASTIKDLDFWIHLGNYIYEHASYTKIDFESSTRREILDPTNEVVTLEDYRKRYALYHTDAGLRNLRRRAPLIAMWDDHELANQAYGNSTIIGAENHQEFCSVDETASDREKDAAKCDRDEGSPEVRFNAAAQAYMEWMPIRRAPGSMGMINYTNIAQTIEWGNLATILTFDTRVTNRSMEPTLSSTLEEFGSYCDINDNVESYSDPNHEAFSILKNISDNVFEQMYNPAFSMLSTKQIQHLHDVFQNSSYSGKPWQIFASPVMMAPLVRASILQFPEYVESYLKSVMQSYVDVVHSQSLDARILAAMELTMTPWNRDDWNGFAVQRSRVLDIVKNNSNNMVILGGGLDGASAWKINKDGSMGSDDIVAINLGVQSVTTPGSDEKLASVLEGLIPFLGEERDRVLGIVAKILEDINTNLVYANVNHRGFLAVKATKEKLYSEYFFIKPEDIHRDYPMAVEVSRGIVANYYCGASFETTSGFPGSLEQREKCDKIEFILSRPDVWKAFVSSKSIDKSLPITEHCDGNACHFDFEDSFVES